MKAVEVQVHWAGERFQQFLEILIVMISENVLILVVAQEVFIEMEHVLQRVNAKIKVDRFLDLVPLG